MKMWKAYVCKPGKKDGRNWIIVVKPPKGLGMKPRRQSSGTDVRQEAEQRAAQIMAEMNNGTLTTSGTAQLVGDVFEAYAGHVLATLDPATAKNVRQSFRRLGLSTLRLGELHRRHVAAARDAMVARKINGKSINIALAHGRAAFRWASEVELVDQDFPHVKPVKVLPTSKQPYTADEVRRILAWVETYQGGFYAPALRALVETGCRANEVLRLRGRDLRRPECLVYFGKTKTGDPRWSGLTRATMDRLPEVGPDEWVFPSRTSIAKEGRVTVPILRQTLERARAALGIVGSLDLHSLRRTHSVEGEAAGLPERLVMRQQGHRSVQQHRAYKARARGDDLVRAAEATAARWAPLTQTPRSLTGSGRKPMTRNGALASSGSRGDLGPSLGVHGLESSTPHRNRTSGSEGSRRVASGLVMGLPHDPLAAAIGAMGSAHGRALYAVVTDPARLLVVRQVLEEFGHGQAAQRAREQA